MDLMHRNRFAIRDSRSAWVVICVVPVCVAAFVVVMVRGGAPWSLVGVLEAAAVAAMLLLTFYLVGAVIVGALLILVRALWWLLQQVHRFVMGVHHPSYVKEEFERTHESRKCSTCGGTYYVSKETPDEDVSAWN